MSKLKLFVWEGVLSDYTDGIMFALAHTEEEAREMIVKKWDDSPGNLEKYREWRKDPLNSDYHISSIEGNLQQTPEVYETPCGFYLFGGG